MLVAPEADGVDNERRHQGVMETFFKIIRQSSARQSIKQNPPLRMTGRLYEEMTDNANFYR